MAWVVISGCLACGPSNGSGVSAGPGADDPKLSGPVVSTVDGAKIGLGEIEQVVKETGLAPKAALQRLQEERLLSARARRAGYGATGQVEREVKRAMVRELLRDAVEKKVTDESFKSDAVRLRYEELGAKMKRAERRQVAHVLFQAAQDVDAGEQLARARQVIQQYRTEPLDTVLQRYAAQDGLAAYRIVAERIPAFPADGPFAQPFKDAAFAADQPGPIAEPVRTRYGWHAMYLVAIEPAGKIALEEVDPFIRQQLTQEGRSKTLDSLAERLRKRTDLMFNDEVIDRVFAQEILPPEAL